MYVYINIYIYIDIDIDKYIYIYIYIYIYCYVKEEFVLQNYKKPSNLTNQDERNICLV